MERERTAQTAIYWHLEKDASHADDRKATAYSAFQWVCIQKYRECQECQE